MSELSAIIIFRDVCTSIFQVYSVDAISLVSRCPSEVITQLYTMYEKKVREFYIPRQHYLAFHDPSSRGFLFSGPEQSLLRHRISWQRRKERVWNSTSTSLDFWHRSRTDETISENGLYANVASSVFLKGKYASQSAQRKIAMLQKRFDGWNPSVENRSPPEVASRTGWWSPNFFRSVP